MKEKEEKAEIKANGRGRRGEREKKKGEEQKGKNGRGRQFLFGFLPAYHRSEVPMVERPEPRMSNYPQSIRG